MVDETNEPVVQPDQSGTKSGASEVVNDKANNDYKRDMLRFKDEARALKAQLEEIELQKQTKKGNYEGVITKLKDDLKAQERLNQKLKLNFADSRIDDALKREAMTKGLKGQSLDVFMRLVDDESKGAIELNEKFDAKSDDITRVVDSHLDRYGDVFKSKSKVVDVTPNNTPKSYEKKSDLSKLSGSEMFAKLKEGRL